MGKDRSTVKQRFAVSTVKFNYNNLQSRSQITPLRPALNLAMITVHFNYAERQLDILRLFSMSDRRIGRHKQVKRATSAWWDNCVSKSLIEEE